MWKRYVLTQLKGAWSNQPTLTLLDKLLFLVMWKLYSEPSTWRRNEERGERWLQEAADDIGARVTWLEEPGGRRSPGEQEGEFVLFTRPQKYYENLRYDTNRPPEDCPQDWELARADAEGAWRWDRAMRAPVGTVYTNGSLTEAGAGAAIYHCLRQ